MVQITADGNTLFVGSRERVLMRKRWLVLLVVLLLLSACTAEGIETKNPSLGEVSMQEESSNLNLIKTPTAAQIAEEQRSYNEKCAEILSAKKIDRVEMHSAIPSYGSDAPMEEYTLETVNAVMIAQWIQIMEDMEVKAVAMNPTGGSMGYSLSFFIDGKEIHIGGGFVDGNIYVGGANSTSVMLKIINYNEMRDVLRQLEEDMGFPKE